MNADKNFFLSAFICVYLRFSLRVWWSSALGGEPEFNEEVIPRWPNERYDTTLIETT